MKEEEVKREIKEEETKSIIPIEEIKKANEDNQIILTDEQKSELET